VSSAAARLCVICVVAAFLGCGTEPPRPSSAPAPAITGRSIVLVTLDTLRRDRLGAYGSTRGLTPALDRFAETAARFTAAVTQVPLTLPAHATLFTGLHPARHGVRTNDGFRLAAGVPLLTEALRTRGYATGAFIGGAPLQASSGLARGFDRYDDQFLRTAGRVERSADEVVDAALAWIETPRTAPFDSRGAPFLAWLHVFDPHSPYVPPAPFAAAHRDTPYDGEVAYTDAALGRLFDRLRQLDLFARSTIIIVADHGEALGEHGERTHGTFLYDATVHVPLLIKLADATVARTIDAPVEIADLAPTIATLAGATLAPVDGQDLLPLMRGDAGDPDRPAYIESYYQHILLGWSPLRAVRTRQWKLIDAPRPELYDLEADPGEQQNRIATRGALAAGLQRTLPPLSEDTSAAAPSTTTSEAAERLRSLGYVSGTTTATAASRGVDPKDRVDVWTAIEDGLDTTTRDPDAARRSFARALQLDAGNGLAMKSLADLDFRAGKLREAGDGYRRAIAAGFRHPDALVNLAAIAERQGRLDEARAVLVEAVQAAKTDADAWNRLGLLDARRGNLDEARRAFTSAMTAEPERAEPYYNLAIVERRAGNETAAQARLQDAIARNAGYPEAHYELGTGYLLAREPERALQSYRSALASRPDYAEALFGAARAALDLGRTDEARRDYEHFIRVAPREYRQQVAAAREALRRLGGER
jgi:choline-sulfatase